MNQERRTVQNIGNAKKRKPGKYAIDVQHERDYENLGYCLIAAATVLDNSGESNTADDLLLTAAL